MKCLRLTHVNLRVEKLEDAVRFYTLVMGLERIERDDSRGRGAWFRLGDAQVHLAEDAAPQPRSKRHFAVEVADLAEAKRTAQEHAAEIDQEEAGRFWMRERSTSTAMMVCAGLLFAGAALSALTVRTPAAPAARVEHHHHCAVGGPAMEACPRRGPLEPATAHPGG